MKTQNSKWLNGIAALSLASVGMLALILAFPSSIGTSQAQSAVQQPSAKVTAKTSNVTLIPETTGTSDWVTILCNNIKMPNRKDLFITASLETGLYTRTLVPPEATARASVQVRV